ncbi:hypothetical protein Snoj_64500 [Streptomyces nojiriensis]|uniref:ABC transporter permease n=1 Tax=Streptomyces nojiriensis TaxID=66374 RepID=A0ABQ3SWR3_9ACTN|nr:hypothetical protein GCM10010205_16070 [Streptomyces nojiriensis]GHI72532.1 hypothetical protein Snoj_64500 [Streptomyces nojiriensis]
MLAGVGDADQLGADPGHLLRRRVPRQADLGVVPLWAVTGGFAATLVIGTLAGLYPAVRAARLSPTLALAAA